MTPTEILIKTEAIAAVLQEYIIYYEPIFFETINKQAESKPRTLRRKYIDERTKDFRTVKMIAGRFSRLLSQSHEKEHSECIDLIHEALEKIKITE